MQLTLLTFAVVVLSATFTAAVPDVFVWLDPDDTAELLGKF